MIRVSISNWRTGNRLIRLAALASLIIVAPAARAELSPEIFARCMLLDPSATERILLADVSEEGDAASLYQIGRFYSDAPEEFRDPIKSEWYLGRAADMGSEPAIAFLQGMSAGPVGAVSPDPTKTPEQETGPVWDGPLRPMIRLEDPDSYLAGVQLTLHEAMEAAFEGGFRSEEQMLAVLGMAIAESALWTQARNWKPEQGLRPADVVIGVQGPAGAWKLERQMHSDRGLWQISSYTWAEYPDAVTDDPTEAANAAYRISNSGTTFVAWDSFASGRAQSHYDEEQRGWPPIRSLVRDFLTANNVAVGSSCSPL